jgi:hypothetical protein
MSTTTRYVAGVLLLCLCTTARGQTEERAEGETGRYNPMFTPEMIARATPDQARRMREAEERNRQSWESRQAALRASRNADEGATRADGGAEASAASGAPRRAGRSKIYRWLDKNGNVHFGDAPAGHDAEEIKVGGVARGPAQAPHTPGATDEER